MARYVQTFMLALLLSMACHPALAAQDPDGFVDDASAKGVAEIEVGKLALEKAVAPDVKTFAQMMVSDHTAANDKLKTIAQSKRIEVSSYPQVMDKIKALILDLRSAKSFDQAYANNQVKAHEAAIELFEKEAANGKDAELKAFASATLLKLKEHLAQAKQLAAVHGGDAR